MIQRIDNLPVCIPLSTSVYCWPLLRAHALQVMASTFLYPGNAHRRKATNLPFDPTNAAGHPSLLPPSA